ncbi:FAD-dependent oxidoreductase [Thermodesulfobacteriota bacterium]
MNFVVIGGDAAGMSAASKAKRNKPDLSVTVLEKTLDVSYSACGMPYNIADPDRNIDDLVVRQASVFREKQEIDLLTEHNVETIDPENRLVIGTTKNNERFERPYDKLLIATGARPCIPEKQGFDLPGVMVLKSLQDGRKIKAYITANSVRKVVIIGMGYIALEMVEALCERGLQVEMIKHRHVLLPWMASDLSQIVNRELDKHCFNLHFGHAVEAIENAGKALKVICSDLSLECDMVLVAIGINPNSDIASAAGLELSIGNAISVDKQLRTSDPDIYAAGDCADAYHVITGEKTWIPLALRANRAGWVVADNVCGKETTLHGIVGTSVFKVFDLQVARTGLNVIEAKDAGFTPAEVIIKTSSRAHAHPGAEPLWVHMVGDKASGRLLGVQMVGHEGVAHRINAPAVGLHAHMTVEQFYQSDLAYAPPFGPTWDPLLTAANQLLKKL